VTTAPITPTTLVADPTVHTPAASRRRRGGWRRALGVILGFATMAAALAGLLAAGMLPRLERQTALDTESAALRDAPPRVNIVLPRRAQAESELILPGDSQAIHETAIHARTNGYLKRWLVDIGDRVKANQLLAEIDTPEVDHSLREAEATLAQAKATVLLAESRRELARVNLSRSRALAARGAATNQELDETRAQMKVADATVEAALADVTAKEASVSRYRDLQAFQKVYAPWDGVITNRNVDPGSLIAVGSGSDGREMFRLAQTDKLRVYVNVPQTYVSAIRVGQDAQILVREYAGRPFVGKVVRTAGAVDPTSRTLRTELQVPNDDQALYSGMYVQVKFRLTRETPPLLVSANAILVDAEGTRVAVLRDGRSVHYQAVELGRDFGPDVEILSGLTGNEPLVANPGESLPEGARVDVVLPKAAMLPIKSGTRG
jgi:RND family efflux transporter MFP subunit